LSFEAVKNDHFYLNAHNGALSIQFKISGYLVGFE